MNNATNFSFSSEKPPMYDICHQYFGADWDRGTIFAYKNTIHAKNPSSVTEDVVAHEQVHLEQQRMFGDADLWWKQYLQDADFRYKQEIPAYKAQLAYALGRYNRNYRRALRQHIYKSFAGLSGGTITVAQAEQLLA